MIRIYTSYWSNLKKVVANDLTPVAISRGKPRWFKGEEEESLFPSWDMIKNVSNLDDASWETKYQFENLNLLDPEATAKELEGKVLMCWEGPGKFCHRQCVASWLRKVPGVEVEELVFS